MPQHVRHIADLPNPGFAAGNGLPVYLTKTAEKTTKTV